MGLRQILPLVFFMISLSGCASYFIRKDCEKIDWYQHGQSVAMSGNRMSGNAVVHRCEQAGADIDYVALDQGFKLGMANYCLPETVLATGKRGEYFSEEMCDGSNIRLLRQRHRDGVLAYCQKANGYTAGAVGKPYNQICPKELEGDFLPEFKRGRKSFLAASISSLDSEIDDLQNQVRNLERRKSEQWFEYNSIRGGNVVKHQAVYDPILHTYRDQTTVEEDQNVKFQRENARSAIQSTENEIQQKEQKASQLREERRKLNAELMTL